MAQWASPAAQTREQGVPAPKADGSDRSLHRVGLQLERARPRNNNNLGQWRRALVDLLGQVGAARVPPQLTREPGVQVVHHGLAVLPPNPLSLLGKAARISTLIA